MHAESMNARALGIVISWLAASPCLAFAPCADHPRDHAPAERIWRVQDSAATGVFHGVGVVTAIDAASGALTLDHDDIKGFMPAMEMMYRVKSPDLAHGLGVGDQIAFDIDAKSYTILGVTLLARAK
jgi:Cu/Ag efflux protein CusF